MDEARRIEFLLQRDGETATRAWIERTLGIYRDALQNESPAAASVYRPLYERAIRDYEDWLERHPPPG